MPATFHQRYADPTHCVRPANRKTAATRGGRTGYAWRKLVTQVKSEETHCWLCGHRVNPYLRFPEPMCASVDHVVPVSLGGAEHDRENLRLAHLNCNQRRWRHPRSRRDGRSPLR